MVVRMRSRGERSDRPDELKSQGMWASAHLQRFFLRRAFNTHQQPFVTTTLYLYSTMVLTVKPCNESVPSTWTTCPLSRTHRPSFKPVFIKQRWTPSRSSKPFSEHYVQLANILNNLVQKLRYVAICLQLTVCAYPTTTPEMNTNISNGLTALQHQFVGLENRVVGSANRCEDRSPHSDNNIRTL